MIFYSVQYIFDKTIAFWYHYRHRDIHLCCDLGMTGGDLASVLRNALLSEQFIHCMLLLWCSGKLFALSGQGAPFLTRLHYLTRDLVTPEGLPPLLPVMSVNHSLTAPWLSTSKEYCQSCSAILPSSIYFCISNTTMKVSSCSLLNELMGSYM